MVLAAEATGLTVEDLLAEVGLERAQLTDSELRIPFDDVLVIWNALRTRTENPTLQLKAPGYLPVGAYEVIEYLIDASPTVGDAMQRFARFFRLIADHVTITIIPGDGEFAMGITLADGRVTPPVFVDYTFSALVTRIRARTRPELVVQRVEVRQPAPVDPSAYEVLFGAPVAFGSVSDRLCFSAKEWESPTKRGDEALLRLMEDHARILADRLPGPEVGIVADVRRVILEALPDFPSADQVARGLHVSTRTLQRRLADVGASFTDVAEAVRSELAKDYLAKGEARISEVAFLLGFSEQSSFNRAFRRWTGVTPGRWRETAST